MGRSGGEIQSGTMPAHIAGSQQFGPGWKWPDKEQNLDIVETLRERARGGPAYDADLDIAADVIERFRSALQMIVGERPCPDNLLGNFDIAYNALHDK